MLTETERQTLQLCRGFAATQGMKLLSGRWKTPILLALLEGPQRFAALERRLTPISAKVLTQRLQELERLGLILRDEQVAEAPKVVVYALTPLGEGVRPVLEALAGWARAVLQTGPADPAGTSGWQRQR